MIFDDRDSGILNFEHPDAVKVYFQKMGQQQANHGAVRDDHQVSVLMLLAHAGNSVVWVFSTTLLQLNTEDRFRGRIFAADFGIAMAIIALSAWLSGQAIDAGVSPRTVSVVVGASMLIPTTLWASAQRLWKQPGMADNG